MAGKKIDRQFYDAILHFEESEEAQDYYYQVMDELTGQLSLFPDDEDA